MSTDDTNEFSFLDTCICSAHVNVDLKLYFLEIVDIYTILRMTALTFIKISGDYVFYMAWKEESLSMLMCIGETFLLKGSFVLHF